PNHHLRVSRPTSLHGLFVDSSCRAGEGNFEICSLSRPVSTPTLMLVAKRVKQWVEPLLYRVIALGYSGPIPPFFTDDIMSSLVRLKPPTFFHNAVHHLLLFGVSEVQQDILALCSGVQDLCLFGTFHALIPVIQSLALRRLQAHCVSMPPPTLRMSLQLTHLYLCGHPKDPGATCTALATLPSLTHFAVDNLALVSHKILGLSPSIRVMVFFDHSSSVHTDEVLDSQVTHDVRFVAMPTRNFVDDWYAAIERGVDYWSDAESFVAKRRSGEIDSVYYVDMI
ncbi:hypothetical protein B0H14DRAFT_1158658, partial [Mycena olivaceomarginata]